MSAKGTPRQKMIGMMYLVLTALLALNVSKEILDSFIIVNDGLEKTNENFSKKNEKVYSDFEAANTKDPKKTGPYYERAKKAQKISADLIKYVKSIKTKLLSETDKITMETADSMHLEYLQSKDNYTIPSEIMIGSNPETPKTGEYTAADLKAKINAARAEFIKLFDNPPGQELFLPVVKQQMENKLGMKTPDPKPKEGEVRTWETTNFEHIPLAAIITILSGIQADVKNAEADVVNQLFQSVKGQDFTFDKLSAKVIAKSSYIIAGDEYSADVLLVASNSTTNPKIIVGDTSKLKSGGEGKELPVEGGLGKYTIRTSAEGLQKWSGVIKVEKPGRPGEFDSYPFSSEYQVAKPAAAVSATKMNVFYIGVDNPVDISAAGVAPENIVASLAGNGGTLTKLSSGKYNVRVVSGSNKCTISVGAKMGTTTRPMGTPFEFRVKQLPTPTAFVAGANSGTLKKGLIVASGNVIPKMENFDFDLKIQIVSFKMSTIVKGLLKEEVSNSGAFTAAQTAMIQGIPTNGKLFFEEIKAKMPDGTTRTLNSIIFKVL
ncbi:MAG TPA: gliding motility protein GldM [Bacteroidia bacterium]|nr:gliding motility protein GldM [Bacteroidia bacterium]HRH07705.1 gliding motility protein GldM [Bacteroidia bacterium]HRH62591.1 gliding motility protein GldM [Bacteroidia bacterium]